MEFMKKIGIQSDYKISMLFCTPVFPKLCAAAHWC